MKDARLAFSRRSSVRRKAALSSASASCSYCSSDSAEPPVRFNGWISKGARRVASEATLTSFGRPRTADESLDPLRQRQKDVEPLRNLILNSLSLLLALRLNVASPGVSRYGRTM
jgi:hypothetical protein